MTLYLRHLVFYFAVALAAMACVGYLYDPLGYFRSHGLRSSWGVGNRVWGEDRLAKEMTLSGQQPQTIIAGTSRVRLGFDVDDPKMRHYLGSAYNLGISGASIDELSPFILSAIAKPSLRTLVIGLDYGQFIRNNNTDSFQPRAFGGLDITGLPRQLGIALWSTSMFKLIEHVREEPYSQTLTGVGNIHNKASRVSHNGHRVTTQNVEKSIIKAQLNSDLNQYKIQMDIVEKLLSAACLRGIETKLFISPTHARQLVLLYTTGDFERFLRWKSELTALADTFRKTECSVSITDFSRISSYTNEPFPEKGDLQHSMRWYWESSHYKFPLGLLVIKRLWGDISAPPNFGISLTSKNADHETSAARNELEHYLRIHPELLMEIGNITLK